MMKLMLCLGLLWSMPLAEATAQQAPEMREASQAPPPPAEYANPWTRRPVCASMFLKSDWLLTPKQRACDWAQNRVLSNNALVGALWSAEVSKIRDAESERGDGFGIRFSRRFAQNAFKATGAYVGGVIAREDPRLQPPYLVMAATPPPKGFWKRTRHALASNFVSYRCVNECKQPSDIDRQFALSRVLGAFASGYGGELLTWDRPRSHERALRGTATAYGATFVNALFGEFTPELSAAASRTFRAIFAPR